MAKQYSGGTSMTHGKGKALPMTPMKAGKAEGKHSISKKAWGASKKV